LHHGQLTGIFVLNEWGNGMAKLTVIARMLPYGQLFTVKGRDAWALLELLKAGANGCTPIDSPGPRWSGYVFSLKRKQGLNIETRHEPHRGAFPGTHARYVLSSAMEIVSRSDVSEREAA
jgi:hypothetical protein